LDTLDAIDDQEKAKKEINNKEVAKENKVIH